MSLDTTDASTMTHEHELDEALDWPTVAGLLAAIGVGLPAGIGTVRAIRNIKALLQAGKTTAAEKAWDKLSQSDRRALDAILKQQAKKLAEGEDLDEEEALEWEEIDLAHDTLIEAWERDPEMLDPYIDEFEVLVAEGEFEMALDLLEQAEPLMLDEYQRMTTGARMKRLRARRTGITQEVRKGKKTRTEIKRENRKSRRRYRTDMQGKLQQKRYRRRTARRQARRRPLPGRTSEAALAEAQQPSPIGLHRFRQKVEPALGRSITDDEATIGCCYVNGDHRSVHRMQDRMGHTLTDRFVQAVRKAFPGADGYTPVSEHHQEPIMSNRPQSLADKLIEYAWAEGNRANQLALGILEHQSTVDEAEVVVDMGDGRHYADGGDIWRLDGLRIAEGTEWLGEQPPADLFERPAEEIAEWLIEESGVEGHSVSRLRTYLTLAGRQLADESEALQNVVTALGLAETLDEANDDKTDDLPAKDEKAVKALAKKMGATKVTGKGPSVNATFNDRGSAVAFYKEASKKFNVKPAMRRSGDTAYTVHIDESIDEAASSVRIPVKGHDDVTEVGWARGTYYYKTKSGATHSAAVPPAKRKDRKYAETKFREMLRNQAQVQKANKYIDLINASLAESFDEANDDKTDDLSAKKEGEIKKLAKEYGAIKVTQKGPSINATFDDQKKAQSFKKAAQAKGGETAMRRSGDTEYTVHIDEDALDEAGPKKVTMSMSDQIDMNRAPQGEITPEIHAWAAKKFGMDAKPKVQFFELRESVDEAKRQGLKVQCGECGKVFTTKNDYPRCPKCKSSDIDLAESVSYAESIEEAYEFLSKVELLDEAGDPAAKAYKMLMNADKALIGRLRDGLAKLTKAVREAQRGQKEMEKRMGVGATTARAQLGIIVKELTNYEGLVRMMVKSADGLAEAEEVLALGEGWFLTEASGAELFAKIKPGVRVTIRTPHGQERSGKAVMRGDYGWVLNLGGAHGTPGIATPENVVKVGKDRLTEDLDEADAMGGGKLGVYTDYEEARTNAEKIAKSKTGLRVGVGIEKRKEYGKTVYTVKFVPKDPSKRQGHELRMEIVEGGLDEAKTTFADLAVGDRFAIPGATTVYEKTTETAAKITRMDGSIGGRPSKQRPTQEVVRMGPKATHYGGPNAMHVKPENKPLSEDTLDERYLEDYGEVRRGSMGYVVVSKEEWKKKHRDFKLTPQQAEDGRRKMMFLSRKSGTVLAPVLVVGLDKMSAQEKASLVEDVSEDAASAVVSKAQRLIGQRDKLRKSKSKADYSKLVQTERELMRMANVLGKPGAKTLGIDNYLGESTMPVPPPDDPGAGFNAAISERAGRQTTTREEALRIYWIAAHRELSKLADGEPEVCAFLNSKRGYDFGRVVTSNFGDLGDEGFASTDPKQAIQHIRLAIREMGEEALMADMNALTDLGGDDDMEESLTFEQVANAVDRQTSEAFDEQKAVKYAQSFRASYGRRDLEQMLKAEKDRLRKATSAPKDIKDYAKLTIRALELALGDDSAVKGSLKEGLDEEMYSLGGGGMKRIDNLPLHVAPGSFYGYGGSSSPDTIIVTKVSGDMVTFTKGPGFTVERREQMPHFLGLADHGTRQWLKLYGNYMDPKLKRTLEANLQGKAGPMNGKVKVKDEQKVRVDVEAAKLKPNEDLYYALESIGSITGQYGEDPVTKKDRGSVHVRRGDIPKIRKDPRFKVLKVHSQPYSYGMGESADGGVFEAAIVVGDKARVIGLYTGTLDEAEKLARAALPITAPSLDESLCEIRVHERFGGDGLVNEDALADCTTVVPLDEFTSAGVPAMAPMDAMLLRMVSPEELEDDEEAEGDALDEATKVTDGNSLADAIKKGDVESDIPAWLGRESDLGYLQGKKIETDPKFKGRKVERTRGRGKGQFGTMTGRLVWTYGGVGNAYEVRLDNRTVLWSPDIRPVGWKVKSGKIVDVTEGLDERQGNAHDSMIAFFVEHAGKSWRAGQVAAQLGISNAEAFKQLSRLVREGTLLFKRGQGYSLNTTGSKGSIQIPADLDARSMRSAIKRLTQPSSARRGYDPGMVEGDLDEARMFDADAYEACVDLATLARATIDGDGGIERSHGHGGFDAAACFPATTPKGMGVRVTVAHHTDEDSLHLILHGDRDSYTSPFAVTVGTYPTEDSEPEFDALLDAMEGYDFECELYGLQESALDEVSGGYAPDVWDEWSDWSPEERIVFLYTVSLKAGYGGDKDFRFKEAHKATKITPDEWERAKSSLIKRRAFNRGGAVMPAVKKRYYDSFKQKRLARTESLDETRSTNAAGFLPSSVFARGDGGGQGPVNYEYGLSELEMPRNKGREGGIRDDGPDTKKGKKAVFSEAEEASIADLIESGFSRDAAIEALGLAENRERIWKARDTKEKKAAKKARAKARERKEWDDHNKAATAKRNEPLRLSEEMYSAYAQMGAPKGKTGFKNYDADRAKRTGEWVHLSTNGTLDMAKKAGALKSNGAPMVVVRTDSSSVPRRVKAKADLPGEIVEAAELDASVELLFVDDQYVVVVPDGGTEYRFDPDEYGEAIAKGEEVAAANQWAFVDNSHLGMPSDISDSIDEAVSSEDAARLKGKVVVKPGASRLRKVGAGARTWAVEYIDPEGAPGGSVTTLTGLTKPKATARAKAIAREHGLTVAMSESIDEAVRKSKKVPGISFVTSKAGANTYMRVLHDASGESIVNLTGGPIPGVRATQAAVERHLSGMKWDVSADDLDRAQGERKVAALMKAIRLDSKTGQYTLSESLDEAIKGVKGDPRTWDAKTRQKVNEDLDEAAQFGIDKMKGGEFAVVRRDKGTTEYLFSVAKAQASGRLMSGKRESVPGTRYDAATRMAWTKNPEFAETTKDVSRAKRTLGRVSLAANESLDETTPGSVNVMAAEIANFLTHKPRPTAKDLQDVYRLTKSAATRVFALYGPGVSWAKLTKGIDAILSPSMFEDTIGDDSYVVEDDEADLSEAKSDAGKLATAIYQTLWHDGRQIKNGEHLFFLGGHSGLARQLGVGKHDTVSLEKLPLPKLRELAEQRMRFMKFGTAARIAPLLGMKVDKSAKRIFREAKAAMESLDEDTQADYDRYFTMGWEAAKKDPKRSGIKADAAWRKLPDRNKVGDHDFVAGYKAYIDVVDMGAYAMSGAKRAKKLGLTEGADEASIDESLVSDIASVLSAKPRTVEQIAKKLGIPATGVSSKGYSMRDLTDQLGGMMRPHLHPKGKRAKKVASGYVAESIDETPDHKAEGLAVEITRHLLNDPRATAKDLQDRFRLTASAATKIAGLDRTMDKDRLTVAVQRATQTIYEDEETEEVSFEESQLQSFTLAAEAVGLDEDTEFTLRDGRFIASVPASKAAQLRELAEVAG